MTKGPGYLLPTVISPTGTRCITLEIPDDPGHIRAFLGQLDMLSFWWTWERDALKQGTQAARRWQSIVDSARQQLDYIGDCPVGFDIRIQDCILQKSLDGGETWIDVADLGDCAGEGPQGPAGADGQDGADGQPVELRTYFGTVQWRVVGTEVWNHLVNLEDICDCEDTTPVNPNFITDGLLCAIAYRLAAEIRKYWDDIFVTDPNVIDDLADGTANLANFIGTFYAPFRVAAGKITAAAGLIEWLSNVFTAAESNSFTTATEYFIAEQFFCELKRRQQREITNAVIVDVVPHIFYAPDLTERQKLATIGLILSAPEEAWQWAAYAAAPYPDGTACAGADCDDDDGFWCVSLLGGDPTTPSGSSYLFASNPVSKAIITEQRGRLSDIAPIGYEATGGFGYPFLPDITTPYPHRELRLRVDFPRPTQISRLEFLSNYNQTAATTTGTRLKVTTGDGTVLINQTVTGVVSGSSVTDVWFGDETVETLIIEGQLWSDMAWGGFATIKLLDFFIQGQGFNPFGVANCVWVEPPSELTPPAHDWTATFSFWLDDYDFTTQAQGSTVPSQTGLHIPGFGWKSQYAASGGLEQIYLRIDKAIAGGIGIVNAIRILWQRQAAAGAGTPFIYLGAGGGSAYWNFPNDSHGIRYDLVLNGAFGSGISYRDTSGLETSSELDWDGSESFTVLHQIKLYGIGTRPAGLAGIPD